MTSSQFCQLPHQPVQEHDGGPSPPLSIRFTRRPRISSSRVVAGAVDVDPRAGWRVATSSASPSAARGSATARYASAVVGYLPGSHAHRHRHRQTLHHYWDVLSRAARDRFGVDLPVRAADHLGRSPSEAAAGAGLRRGHAPRRGDPGRRALSRRRGDGPRLARGRALHPHHEPPGGRPPTARRRPGCSGSGCPTTSCTAR